MDRRGLEPRNQLFLGGGVHPDAAQLGPRPFQRLGAFSATAFYILLVRFNNASNLQDCRAVSSVFTI